MFTHSRVTLFLSFSLFLFPGIAAASEVTVTVPDGTSYEVEIDDRPLDDLSEEEQSVFEQKRTMARQRLIEYMHSYIGEYIRIRRWARRVSSQENVLSRSEELLATVRNLTKTVDSFLVDHRHKVVSSPRQGVRFSLGAAFSAAAMNRGISPGRWINLNVELSSTDGKRFRSWLTLDRENLACATPFMFSGGVGSKIQYFIAMESIEPEEGLSNYPFLLLPHTQVTDRSVSVGYSFGFFLPAWWTLNLTQTLQRTGPLDLSTTLGALKNVATACASFLIWKAKD